MIKAAVRFLMSDGLPPVNPGVSKIITTIQLDGPPSSSNVVRCTRKYNKKGWLSFEWDDASLGAIEGLSILNGKFYTDGCGNYKNYSAALAINGAYEGTGIPYAYESGMTKAIMRSMILKGWEISDHGYYHDPVGFGAEVTAMQSTALMQLFIKSLLNYWTRSKVVPQNYAGHALAADAQGYIYVTSQGTFDSYSPEWVFAPAGDFGVVPVRFGAVRRDFTDKWVTDLDHLKGMIDRVIAGNDKFYRVGSHTIDGTAFDNLMNYIQNSSSDKVMVCSTREVMEYREVAAMPFTKTVVGNTIVIETDLRVLDPKNRWKDQSFMVTTDRNVTGVTVSSGSASFNSSTGLVNTFLETNLWQ